jgi:tRNA threonylcarbamoyladenosine biosynthesis protein TsaB
VTLLAVDTALGACSVAIVHDDGVLAHRFVLMERGHAEALGPMVEEAMAEAGLSFATIERLAVTTGPGTFTGQRVGLAFMRGLRVALKRPLTGITTLAAMAEQAKAQSGLSAAAALHDAKRGEVYLQHSYAGEPAIMPFETALEMLARESRPLALAGTAAPAAAAQLASAVLSDIRQPDALWVAKLAQRVPVQDGPPKPLYLRAPDAKLPRPK